MIHLLLTNILLTAKHKLLSTITFQESLDILYTLAVKIKSLKSDQIFGKWLKFLPTSVFADFFLPTKISTDQQFLPTSTFYWLIFFIESISKLNFSWIFTRINALIFATTPSILNSTLHTLYLWLQIVF